MTLAVLRLLAAMPGNSSPEQRLLAAMPGNSSPEQREREARRNEKVAELERQVVEVDQQRWAQLYAGIPADAIPGDVLPAAAMLQAAA
jgi:hypothetical protein